MLDQHWKDHLATLDALRQVVHLRAYAQKTPLNEYKAEAFALFERMLSNIREDVTRTIAHAQFQMQAPPPLPDLPDFLTSNFDPFTASDDTVDIDSGTMSLASGRAACRERVGKYVEISIVAVTIKKKIKQRTMT